jgi:hypothetical protein
MLEVSSMLDPRTASVPVHGFVAVRIPFHGGTEFSVLTEAVPA